MFRLYRLPALIVGMVWMVTMMCLPATAQVKESTDFHSLKINGHHYLFSTMNADVSYTISVDTARPELPVVEYDCGNRRDIEYAISDAVTWINYEKEKPDYLSWQEYILDACKSTKQSLLQTLTNIYNDDSQFEKDASSEINTIEGMLDLYDRLINEIAEYIDELKGQGGYSENNVSKMKSRISEFPNSNEQVDIKKSSQSSYQGLKEYMWDRREDWGEVCPPSLRLETSSHLIGSEVLVMIQNCNDKRRGYVQHWKDCLAVLSDVLDNTERNLKSAENDFKNVKENEQDKEAALNACLDIFYWLQAMELHKVVEICLNEVNTRKLELNNELRSLEDLVYECIDILNIYNDFYVVFPKKVIEYRDWLQGISDMVMSWEADNAAMIEENNGILEYPSSIVFDGVEYIVFRIEDGIPRTKLSNLTVKLPSTIQYLSYRSLYSEAIVKVESLNPIPPVMERPDVFYFYFTDFNTDDNVSNYDNMTLVVPAGCKEAYVSEKSPLRDTNGYWWYLFKDIKTFSEVNGVETIDAEADGIRMQNGVLVNENGLDITVYDVSGRIIYTGNNSEVAIPQKGTLIVRVGTKTIKIHS